MAFAIKEILDKTKNKIILTRPIVEAGENLGFLPGDVNSKVEPYFFPLYDCMDKILGWNENRKEYVEKRCELSPLAYLRGRTFLDSIAILDESQNASYAQMKLFLTRLGNNSKIIITGDPSQSDLGRNSQLSEVIKRLSNIERIGFFNFTDEAIVRHPLVSKIIKVL